MTAGSLDDDDSAGTTDTAGTANTTGITNIDAMLVQAARLSVRIRREYARIKTDPGARYFTYVLLLQRGKLYVGSSDNIVQRLMEHHAMSPSSAVWVREHGPVQRVVEVCRNSSADDETYKTLEYMTMFGWDNVRGAGWCRSDMARPPQALETFERDPARPWHFLGRREIDVVLRHVRDLTAELTATPPAPPAA